MRLLFLHHSTGATIWNGDKNPMIIKALNKIKPDNEYGRIPNLFKKYNKSTQNNYQIEEKIFPKATPYGWNNYPFDYYNIWVKNEGDDYYMNEPTLENLTKEYNVIIFKHCFPVSNIKEKADSANINSDYKSIENYMLQYDAIRDKLHAFPNTKFILFTGAVQVRSQITEEEAQRTRKFFEWVKYTWDLPEDNIYLWDFYELQTQGGLYFKDDFAVSESDSHPNPEFADFAAKKLFSRIIDVIENEGTTTKLTGELKQ